MVAIPKYETPPHSLTAKCVNQAPVLLLDSGDQLDLLPALPTNWNGQILSGGQVHCYHGSLGEVVIQDYQSRGWSMRLTNFHFSGNTLLNWYEDAPLCIQFSLKGSFKYLSSQVNVNLKTATTNSTWGPNPEKQVAFKKNEQYVLFQVFYSAEMVRQLFPEFTPRPRSSEAKAVPIEREWLDAIYQILDCPYDNETRDFFYENRIRDLLLFTMLTSNRRTTFEKISDEEVRKVHEVDALILEDLRKWLHIPALAKKVHMSEFRLKIAFKQVIGVHLFERLRIARLEKAKQLLTQTNLQIKVIHREVGYKSLSGFEEAFKERYGIGPSAYRTKYATRP